MPKDACLSLALQGLINDWKVSVSNYHVVVIRNCSFSDLATLHNAHKQHIMNGNTVQRHALAPIALASGSIRSIKGKLAMDWSTNSSSIVGTSSLQQSFVVALIAPVAWVSDKGHHESPWDFASPSLRRSFVVTLVAVSHLHSTTTDTGSAPNLQLHCIEQSRHTTLVLHSDS